MNIILLIIDSLRYDYIGTNGNDWIKTPILDALAERSWVFDRNFAASFPTIPHRTDVITGKYGAPIFPWLPLRWDHVTLPRVLAEHGYVTQLIHDTPHLVNGGHNFDFPFHAWTQLSGAETDRPWIDAEPIWLDNWAWDPMFDQFDRNAVGPNVLRSYCAANRGRKRDEEWNTPRLFKTAARWLKANQERDNFFLWLDCFDPHEPWDVPPEYASLYDPDPDYDGRIDPRAFSNMNSPKMTEPARQRVRAWYSGKVSWVDRWFGEFWSTLEETGLSERTAIVVTADHGTNLGEWGGKFHERSPVHEQEAHTPMMLYVPGSGSGRCNDFVQPQDIFATLCGVANSPVPDGIESHDILTQAMGKTPAARQGALSGVALGVKSNVVPGERVKADSRFFTVFGDDGYLIFDADPARCSYYRYGTEENVANFSQSEVERLHRAGIDEIERRGTDPKVVSWLRAGAHDDLPHGCVLWDGHPGPAGFTQYFFRLHDGRQ